MDLEDNCDREASPVVLHGRSRDLGAVEAAWRGCAVTETLECSPMPCLTFFPSELRC